MYLDLKDSFLYIGVFRLLAVCSCFVSLYVLIYNCSTIDLVLLIILLNLLIRYVSMKNGKYMGLIFLQLDL